jgi:hypothetical protein
MKEVNDLGIGELVQPHQAVVAEPVIEVDDADDTTPVIGLLRVKAAIDDHAHRQG